MADEKKLKKKNLNLALNRKSKKKKKNRATKLNKTVILANG